MAAGRVTEQKDVLHVAAIVGDVLHRPLESRRHVLQVLVVPGHLVGVYRLVGPGGWATGGARGKSHLIGGQAVVHVDHDPPLPGDQRGGEGRGVHIGIVICPATAVHIKDHRAILQGLATLVRLQDGDRARFKVGLGVARVVDVTWMVGQVHPLCDDDIIGGGLVRGGGVGLRK